jgi:hypothetical protein
LQRDGFARFRIPYPMAALSDLAACTICAE